MESSKSSSSTNDSGISIETSNVSITFSSPNSKAGSKAGSKTGSKTESKTESKKNSSAKSSSSSSLDLDLEAGIAMEGIEDIADEEIKDDIIEESSNRANKRNTEYDNFWNNPCFKKKYVGPLLRCLYIFGIILLTGIVLTLSNFLGVYIFQSQKCPYDVQRASNIACNISADNMDANGTAIINGDVSKYCDLFYKNYNEKFAVCIENKVLGIQDIVSGYECDTNVVAENYCNPDDKMKGWITMVTLLGVFFLVADCLIIGAILFLAFYPIFLPSEDINEFIEKVKYINEKYKSVLLLLIRIIFTLIMVTCGYFVFVNLLPYVFNGSDGLNMDNKDQFKCKFYQKCIGATSNCFDSDQYCYTSEFIVLHIAMIFFFLISLSLVHLAFYSIIGLGVGIFLLGKWLVKG